MSEKSAFDMDWLSSFSECDSAGEGQSSRFTKVS